jgi:hypothetical protein
MSTEMTPEEARREMKRRFDAVNKSADDRRETRIDAGVAKDARAKERRLQSETAAPVETEESTGTAPGGEQD